MGLDIYAGTVTRMENWRDQILSAISQPNQPPYTPWPEDNEKPYYTDKPDWDAFGAMLLVAACHTYEEPVPPTVEKDWNFGEHPLVARLASDDERVWSLFRGVTWWLPLTDSFLFQGPLPTDEWRRTGTSGSILWSPVLHRTTSGCGPCFGA